MTPRARKILFLLLLLAIPGLVVEVLLSQYGQTAIAHRVLRSVDRQLPGAIELGTVHATLGGEVSMQDIRLLDSTGAVLISAGSVNVSLSWLPLLRNSVQIRSLRVKDLQCRIEFDSSGKASIESNFTAPPSTPHPEVAASPAWSVSIDDMAITGNRFELYAEDTLSLSFHDWTLAGSVALDSTRLISDATFDALAQFRFDARAVLRVDTAYQIEDLIIGFMIDSSFASTLPDPFPELGTLTGHIAAATAANSLLAKGFAASSAVGRCEFDISTAASLDFNTVAGKLRLVDFKPAVILRDTTDLLLNGDIQFTKVQSSSPLNGWNVELALAAPTYGDYRAESIHGSILTRDSVAVADLTVASANGDADVRAKLTGFDPKTMRMEGTARLEGLELRAFSSAIPDTLAPLYGTVALNAMNIASPDPQISVSVNLHSLSLGSIHGDSLYLIGSLDGREVRVDSFDLALPGAMITGEADGSLDSSVEMSVQIIASDLTNVDLIHALFPILDSLSGDLQADALATVYFISADSTDIAVSGNLHLSNATWNESSIQMLSARIMSYQHSTGALSAALNSRNLSYGELQFDSLRTIVHGTLDSLSADLRLWARSDTLQLTSVVELHPFEHPLRARVNSMNALTYGIVSKIDDPCIFTWDGERLTVDALLVRSPVATLLASGTVALRGEQDLVLELSGVKTVDATRLFQLRLPETTLNARLLLSGTHDHLIGDISLTTDSMRYEGNYIADELVLSASVSEVNAVIDGTVTWYNDTLLVVHGTLPATLSLDSGFTLNSSLPMFGQASLREQPLRYAEPYMAFGTRLGGYISAEATIIGSPSHPNWYGDFRVRDGIYRDPRVGVNYEKLSIEGKFASDTLQVHRFHAESEGSVNGSGWLAMSFPLPKAVDLSLDFENFEVVNSPTKQGRISGHASISGPLDRLFASGDIELDEGLYRITQATGKQIEEIDLQKELALLRGDTTARKGFLVREIYEPMSLDIKTSFPGNLWLRGSGLNIELSGDLTITKDAKLEPQIVGEVRVRQGKAEYFGRDFKVDQQLSYVTFDGPANDPRLNIVATYKTRNDTTITITLTGTAQNTLIKLSPDNALYLMTSGASGALDVESVTSAGIGQASQLIGKAAGLDVFEFHQGEGGLDNLSAGKLEVGTYVTDRLFVRVLQPVESIESGQEVTVEYRLLDWLRLSAQQKGTQQSLFELLMQWAWH